MFYFTKVTFLCIFSFRFRFLNGSEESFVDAARKEAVLKDGIEGFTNVKSLSTA